MITPRLPVVQGPRRAVAVAAAVVAWALWSAPTAAPAAPIVVGPSDLDDGTLRLTPTVQVVDDSEAAWVLANGSDRALTFALSLHEIVVGRDGQAAAGATLSDPAPVGEVVLGPREQARIAIPVADPTALRVTTDGAGRLEAFAVAPQSGDVAVTIDLDTAQGRAAVAVSAEAPTVANLAVGVTGWPGRDLGTATAGPFVVVPPGVKVVVDLDGAVGPTTMKAAVTTATGESATAESTTFVVTRSGLAIVAAAALAVATGALVLVLRRRTRSRASAATDANPTSQDQP